MTSVDDLWFLADEASQRAEQAYHAVRTHHTDFVEYDRTRRVSRGRFRTLATRIKQCGAPFGAHTIVYRRSGEVLLVRHEGVDKWVLPGGGVDGDESFREAAARELDEEAGIDADYEGLAMVTRVSIECDDYQTWGLLPVFEARARSLEPSIEDPDDEISAAEWFTDLPPDTRDRSDLLAWRRARSL